MSRYGASFLAGIAGMALLAMTLPLAAEDAGAPRQVMSLTGNGKARAEPDMAIITLGVVREAETARAALSANNQAMNAVMATVTGAGIAQKDIQTSGFSISPKYHYPKRKTDGEQEAPRITGYTVSNTMSVAVRDLDRLGAVLDGVVSAGSNQINGISFDIAEPEPLHNEARKLATRDAIAKANLYAEAAGVKLDKIVSISEHITSILPPQPMPQARTMAMEAAQGVPVARGEQEITAQVHITWQIR